MIAVAPALAGFRPPHCDYNKVRDGRENGAPPAVPAERGEPETRVVVAPPPSLGGLEISASPEYAQILEIIKYLETAQKKLKDKVKEVIDKAETEMKEADKTALKKRLAKLQANVKALRAKIDRLLTLPPEKRLKIAAEIEVILNQAGALSGAAGDLSKIGDAEHSAGLIEAELSKIDAKTNESLIELNRARRSLAFILTANASKSGEIGAPDARAVVDEWFDLADRGQLNADTANQSLRRHGFKDLEFNDSAFARLLTGGDDRWFHAETVSGREELCRRINSLIETFETFGLRQEGAKIDWERFDDPTYQVEKGKLHVDLRVFIADYAQSEDFFTVARGAALEGIGREYDLDLSPANLNGKTWIKLKGHHNLSPRMKRLMEGIDSREGLTARQKWDKLVLELIRELFDGKHIAAPAGIKDPSEQQAWELKRLKELMREVALNPAVRDAFIEEFRRVIINGKGGENFNYDGVMKGHKPPRAEAPKPKRVLVPVLA